jgi:predicted DNA-binding transcriptional regulator YafY
VETRADGLVVRLRIIISRELIRKLASYGAELRVLAPAHLKEQLRLFFKEAYEANNP